MEKQVKCKFHCGDAKSKQCCKFCGKRAICGIACMNEGKCKGSYYITKDEISYK